MWNLVGQWFQTQPNSVMALFIAVIFGWMTLSFFLVRTFLKQAQTNQNQIVGTQKEIASILNNHLETIAKEMATTNEVLRVLSGQVLQAALRAPDTVAVHIPVEATPKEPLKTAS